MNTFLSNISHQFEGIRLNGDRVWLRWPKVGDHDEWATVRSDSRAFLEPWEPTWPTDVLSRSSFRRRIKRYARDARDDKGYSFFIFQQSDNALIGGINLSHVHRGVSQTCSIGYWTAEPYARLGYMSDAVRTVLRFIFDELSLHRVEAACVPSNIPSRDLLRKVGFTEEGYARKYLRINGRWEDHLLFAYLAADPRSK